MDLKGFHSLTPESTKLWGFLAYIAIGGYSLRMEFLFLFFETFTQHVDEVSLLRPNNFHGFGLHGQKLLYGM